MQYKSPWRPAASTARKESIPSQEGEIKNLYLTAKGVPLGEGCYLDGDKLIIPMNTGGAQEIYPDGRKHFPAGTKKGWYCIKGKTECVLIAEGYATGYSIHLASGCTVYISFDAGQLPKTALAVREAHPEAEIIIAGDRDPAGIKYADKAAIAVRGVVSLPPVGLTGKGKQQDWNDFFLDAGVKLTVEALNECQYEPVPLEPTLTYETPSLSLGDFTEDQVREMLVTLSPDCDNDEWVRIGMAIKRGGYNLAIWEAWSAGSSKYKKGECWTRWKTFGESGAVNFGTLVHLASENGWKPSVQVEEVSHASRVDLVALANRKLTKAKSAEVVKGFDIDPMQLPGLIGDTVRWINETAIFSQPLLAMMNVITFAGAVIGRTYSAEPLDTRANIYMVGLVGTGLGKDLSRKRITQLAQAADLLRFLGDNSVRSESGIARAIEGKMSQVMMLDEFGSLLDALNDDRATHLKNVMKLFIILYSSSNSVYAHGTYADAKLNPITLDQPALSIYGTSTESTYAPALKKRAIESGELNRFVVLPNNNDPEPRHNLPRYNLPQSLVEAWKVFGNLQPSLAKTNAADVKIKDVPVGKCGKLIEDLMDEQCAHRHDKYASLWGRFRENSIKIGLIFSVMDAPINPVMKQEWLEMGAKIVRASISYMIHLSDSNIAESQYHGWQQDIIKAIAKQGEMSQNEIRRIMQKIEPRKFAELLQDMQQYGIIVKFERKSARGRPSTMFKLSDEES